METALDVMSVGIWNCADQVRVVAYNSYIRLVATRILVTITIEDKEVYQYYPDLVSTVHAIHAIEVSDHDSPSILHLHASSVSWS